MAVNLPAGRQRCKKPASRLIEYRRQSLENCWPIARQGHCGSLEVVWGKRLAKHILFRVSNAKAGIWY